MSSEAKVLIRRATSWDAATVAFLGRTTFGETFGHLFRDPNDVLDYYERTFSEKKIEKSLQKERNLYWLAFVDDLPVGYAKLKLHSPSQFLEQADVCQLQKIYVLKNYLSLRIGLKLQQELIDAARGSGSSYVWLSVLKENERAILFYEKNGFEQIGDHDFSIGKEDFDFMAMARKLR